MDKTKDLHKYWKNPTPENRLIRYAGGIRQGKRSEFLVGLVKDLFPYYQKKQPRILELGCNIGRNLWYLYNAGFGNLSGIEINERAVQVNQFMGGGLLVHKGAIEDILPALSNFQLIFSMAVLMHVGADVADGIFDAMALQTKYIITIESEVEKNLDNRNIGRNYKKVFISRGFKQKRQIMKVPGLAAPYHARVFERLPNWRKTWQEKTTQQ
jgi:SAM-dependent methyltransferase